MTSRGIFKSTRVLSDRLRTETVALLSCQFVLATVVVLTFLPSVNHVFRADYWKYLKYVKSTEGFWDTWMSSYSITRQTDHGDAHLFRPLLEAVLAIERSLFGANFTAYQIVGMLLHIANTCALFHVLRRTIRVMWPSPRRAGWSRASLSDPALLLPFSASAFFAVNVPGAEMVIWCNIVAYQVWILLFLWIVLFLLRIQSGQRLGKAQKCALWGTIFCMSLICEFTFPIGAVVAAFGAYVSKGTWIERTAVFFWLLSPLIVSGGINIADYCYWDQPVSLTRPSHLLLNTRTTFTYLILQPFFPELNAPQAHPRTYVPGISVSGNQGLFSVFGLMLACSLFAIYRRTDREWRRRVAPFVVAVVLFALLHGIMIAMRLSVHHLGISLLWISSYYCHFFLIYGLLAFVALVSVLASSRSVWPRFCVVCVSAGLLVLSRGGASRVHDLCVSYADLSLPVRNCSAEISRFIERQREEGAPPPSIYCSDADENWLGRLGGINDVLNLYPACHAPSEDKATHVVFNSNDGVEIVPKECRSAFLPFSASAPEVGSPYDASHAFNSRQGGFWEAPMGKEGGVWLERRFYLPVCITKYSLYSGSPPSEDYYGRMPKTWIVMGSNDGKSWKEIDRRTDQGAWSPDQRRAFSIANPKEYTRYRFVILEGQNRSIVRLSMIRFLK